MGKVSIESRETKISDRARQTYREEHGGEDIPVPDHYLRRAGAIQPKAIPVENLTAQNDT